MAWKYHPSKNPNGDFKQISQAQKVFSDAMRILRQKTRRRWNSKDIFDDFWRKERYKTNVHERSVTLDLYNGATKKLQKNGTCKCEGRGGKEQCTAVPVAEVLGRK